LRLEEEFVKTFGKLTLAVGGALIAGTIVYYAAKGATESLAKQVERLQAEPTAAPVGWDYCTQPSYYIRACEGSPYTRRWTGGNAGDCANVAICGAHTQPCQGDDGITYAMMDQGGARYYPKPQDSAGPTVIQNWINCYVNKLDVFGTPYPCHAVTSAPGGRQAPPMLTLAQLPAGNPQIPSFCALYHCTNPPCPTPVGPSPTAAPITPPPTVPPVCPTCAPTCAVATATRTKTPTKTRTPTPHVGPQPTKTSTPHIGPAPTKTPTPSIGPHS
jgi:hypothetical protein